MRKKFLKIILTFAILLFLVFNTMYINSCNTGQKPNMSSNFLSRSTVLYKNINNKDVSVDLFYRVPDEAYNNPNVAQAIMLKQCMDYKTKYPEKDVTITFTSYHLSIVASVCLDPDSDEYGKMKSLYNCDFKDGYYRISYLLVKAAKLGIHVTAIGHIDGAAVLQESGKVKDLNHTQYFLDHMEDNCYTGNKKVKDFLVARTTDWTAVGDKASVDMMHLKTCTVSNYIDNNGVEHGAAVWIGSINLDGIDMYGSNGNDSIQTGALISDHEEIRRVIVNLTNILVNYCKQEDASLFRDKVIKMNTEQIRLINAGKENEIDPDKQIVYLGTKKDKVFEFYFTPFGGSNENWDTELNPLSRYISKLLPSVSGDNYIEFMWNNVKFVSTFGFAKTIEDVLQYSFTNNTNLNNKLYLRLNGIDTSKFKNLKQGKNIGFLSINQKLSGNHAKDLQLSYVENGKRQYVTMFSSLNFHSGAVFGQPNTILVIKETKETGNNLYVDFAGYTVPGLNLESSRIQPRLI